MKYILPLLFLPLLSYSQCGIIDCGILPSKCLVVHNLSFEEAKKCCTDSLFAANLPEEYFDPDYCYTVEVDVDSVVLFYMIFNWKLSDSFEDYCTQGHETIHLIQGLSSRYGFDMTTEAECTAYMYEFIMEKVHKIVTKK